jgi:hypothetical protein
VTSPRPDPYVDDFSVRRVPEQRGPAGVQRPTPPRPAAAYGHDTGAWVAPQTPPAWQAAIRGDRVTVAPGVALPWAAFGAATLAWCPAVGFGVLQVNPSWSALAAIFGVAGLALALRGYPLVGSGALLVAVACWGFVCRRLVPESIGDLAGDAKLIGANLAFVVPLVAGFLAGIWVDGRRTAAAALRTAMGGRRWFGVNRGEPEPQLPALEAIPSARFFALPEGRCAHLVAAGRSVALVATTVWPRGEYTVAGNRILRNGRPFAPGTDDVDGVVDDLRAWAGRLAATGATCRAFLVVHPASERLTDAVRMSLPLLDGVQVVPAPEFAEAVGGFLAARPHLLDARVLEPLVALYPGNPGS